MAIPSGNIKATVITDASFCPRTLAAGWAAWVRIDTDPRPICRYGQLGPSKTSSEAEVKAALNGAWIAGRLGAKKILIQTDCMTVLHLAAGRCSNLDLTSLWVSQWDYPEFDGVTLEVRHVKGHNYHKQKDARTYVNDWCDRHAKKAMRDQRHGRKTKQSV